MEKNKSKNSFCIFTKKQFFFLVLLFFAFFFAKDVYASAVNGTVDSTYKYAWGENIGWVNFGCDECDVQIADSGLTGYAWSSVYGWINLNPTHAGVQNNSEGVLSGHAWSSNLGWINFSGVIINSEGEFLGYAAVESDGSQINFNCSQGASCVSSDFKVKTDWRPASIRASAESGGGSSGSVSSHSVAQVVPSPAPIPPATPAPTTPSLADKVIDVITYPYDAIKDFINNKPAPVVEVPQEAPLALKFVWDVLPVPSINTFVFAPLPYEINVLAEKFPELGETFREVGIERFSDLSKLVGVNLNIPGVADILNNTIQKVGLENIADIDTLKGIGLNVTGLPTIDNKFSNDVGVGNFSLIKGIPVSNLSVAAKESLPAEFVFARSLNERVDLNVSLSVDEKGDAVQSLAALPGTNLNLVVKPISKATGVTGYIVFKSSAPKRVGQTVPRSFLGASILAAAEGLVQKNDVPIERELVLSSFEYIDPDKDGIYTANVTTPIVPGEYEIITVIDYVDPVLGSRKIAMTTVIDPEGYVFEKWAGKETRIPSAVVSIYVQNRSTHTYELWKAEDYSQQNPQTTDISGTYSFLVPEGTYYISVEAPGYKPYTGKAFNVVEGGGVHQNIELESTGTILKHINIESILLFVVCILLVYNLYRNNKRDKLFKSLNQHV